MNELILNRNIYQLGRFYVLKRNLFGFALVRFFAIVPQAEDLFVDITAIVGLCSGLDR